MDQRLRPLARESPELRYLPGAHPLVNTLRHQFETELVACTRDQFHRRIELAPEFLNARGTKRLQDVCASGELNCFGMEGLLDPHHHFTGVATGGGGFVQGGNEICPGIGHTVEPKASPRTPSGMVDAPGVQNASDLVRQVESGEVLQITVPGRPAARMIPTAPKAWQRGETSPKCSPVVPTQPAKMPLNSSTGP